MFGGNRDELREKFRSAWHKAREGLPLDPLDTVIAEVVAWHPEYHAALGAPAGEPLQREYLPEDGETNPFLHMGLHIGLREQVGTNRPAGIAAVHQALAHQCGDAHAAEHLMMDCLAQAMWQAQRDGVAPDEQTYLKTLQALLKR